MTSNGPLTRVPFWIENRWGECDSFTDRKAAEQLAILLGEAKRHIVNKSTHKAERRRANAHTYTKSPKKMREKNIFLSFEFFSFFFFSLDGFFSHSYTILCMLSFVVFCLCMRKLSFSFAFFFYFISIAMGITTAFMCMYARGLVYRVDCVIQKKKKKIYHHRNRMKLSFIYIYIYTTTIYMYRCWSQFSFSSIFFRFFRINLFSFFVCICFASFSFPFSLYLKHFTSVVTLL